MNLGRTYFLYWASPNNFSSLWQCLSPLSVSLCLLRKNIYTGHKHKAFRYCVVVFVFWDFKPFWKNICTDHTRKACRHCALSLVVLRLKEAAENWHCPPSFPKPREHILQMALRSPFFSVSRVKKTYQCSQLGMIDLKRLSEYGVNQEPIWEMWQIVY